MALTRGFIRNAATTPLDARLADMALVTANADGSPRPGVLSQDGANLLTALATMNVAVAADADFVTTKGKADGVVIFTNDGIVNVAIPAAPASNSRIDTIWVKHEDNTTGDAASLPIFGVASGAAAAIPTPIAIPTGALELGTLRVYSGTTAANGGANTLTNTFQMTALRGAPVPFRTKVELNAWLTATLEQRAIVLATGAPYRWSGLAPWLPTGPAFPTADAYANGTSSPVAVAFAALPTIPVSLSVTAEGPCKALITFRCAAQVVAGYMDIGVAVSGATTLAAGETAPGVLPLGAILDIGVAAFFPATVTKLVSLNAGVNTFTVQALIGGAGGTKTVDNPYLIVEAVG